ncbi:MAG: hypothetical protein P8Y91_02545 [Desulfuromonadales bacterium]|jgi:hypothetical protein
MVVGFNHNVHYQGVMYHVQTEDSGIRSPHIITLLYRGGTILASQKTSYADITKIDNLEHVVEELMKDQHKNMLRRLKAGEFDETIARSETRLEGKHKVASQAPVSPGSPAATSSADGAAAARQAPRSASDNRPVVEQKPQQERGDQGHLDASLRNVLMEDDT